MVTPKIIENPKELQWFLGRAGEGGGNIGILEKLTELLVILMKMTNF